MSARLWWWDEAATSREPFVVPDLVWVGLVATITSPRVLTTPLNFAVAWSADPRYWPAGSGPDVMAQSARSGAEVSARGNLVTDADIAAVAAGLGAAWSRSAATSASSTGSG